MLASRRSYLRFARLAIDRNLGQLARFRVQISTKPSPLRVHGCMHVVRPCVPSAEGGRDAAVWVGARGLTSAAVVRALTPNLPPIRLEERGKGMDRRDTIKWISGYCIAIMGATGIDDRDADGRDNAPTTPDNEGAGAGGVLKRVDADGCFAGRLDARGFSRGSFHLLTGAETEMARPARFQTRAFGKEAHGVNSLSDATVFSSLSGV